MTEKEQQFERIYEETKDFGRTQFVREIQMQINDNKKKDKEIKELQKKVELGEHYKHLYSEVKKQKDDVVEYCKNSIKSINDRLAFVDTKKSYPNEHQRVRLKAFRTKCKEILRLLGECNE